MEAADHRRARPGSSASTFGAGAPVRRLEDDRRRDGLSSSSTPRTPSAARSGGRLIGSFGDAEVFSFHATKFFNTFEGGAIVTDDDELADRLG